MANKPATIRFYVDADTLGLAHILTKLRYDVTCPGDPGGVRVVAVTSMVV